MQECRKRGLPLNEGKSVLQSYCATILGGELDGVAGRLMHARDKSFRLSARSLALLSLPLVPQVAAQHWAGLFCFMASFRRPIFAVVQEIFPFIVSFNDDAALRLPVRADVRDEIIVAALLSPLSFCNLRAPIRPCISISDASEEGGAAGEAVSFVSALDRSAIKSREDGIARDLEEAPFACPPALPLVCAVCKGVVASGSLSVSCGVGCNFRLCSAKCWFSHSDNGCRNAAVPEDRIAVFADAYFDHLAWSFLTAGAKVCKPAVFQVLPAIMVFALEGSSLVLSPNNRLRNTVRPLGCISDPTSQVVIGVTTNLFLMRPRRPSSSSSMTGSFA